MYFTHDTASRQMCRSRADMNLLSLQTQDTLCSIHALFVVFVGSVSSSPLQLL